MLRTPGAPISLESRQQLNSSQNSFHGKTRWKKIALISGGTSGIGAETAKLFQSEGATVVVTGSSERSVAAAKAALPGIEVLVSDAGNVAATKALVDQVKAKHGRIDVLFVNAGIAKFMPIAQVDEAFYDSHFNINVKGAYFLIKHAIPAIPDGGAIILTASVAGANGGLPGSSIFGRIDQGKCAAFVRPHQRQVAGAARHPGQHHQPRSDRSFDPRQRPDTRAERQLHRGREDPHSARPYRHIG